MTLILGHHCFKPQLLWWKPRDKKSKTINLQQQPPHMNLLEYKLWISFWRGSLMLSKREPFSPSSCATLSMQRIKQAEPQVKHPGEWPHFQASQDLSTVQIQALISYKRKSLTRRVFIYHKHIHRRISTLKANGGCQAADCSSKWELDIRIQQLWRHSKAGAAPPRLQDTSQSDTRQQ